MQRQIDRLLDQAEEATEARDWQLVVSVPDLGEEPSQPHIVMEA